MIEKKCGLCGKLFGGHKESQVEYQMRVHLETKHKGYKITEKVNQK